MMRDNLYGPTIDWFNHLIDGVSACNNDGNSKTSIDNLRTNYGQLALLSKHACRTEITDDKPTPLYGIVPGFNSSEHVIAKYTSTGRLRRQHNRLSIYMSGGRTPRQVNLINSSYHFSLERSLTINSILRRNPDVAISNPPVSYVDDILNSAIRMLPAYYTLFAPKNHYQRGTYIDMHYALSNFNRPMNLRFKDSTLAVTFGTIVDLTTSKVITMIAIKPGCVEYFNLMRLKNSVGDIESLDPSIFTVLVDEEFYTGNSSYSEGLLKMVKKGIIDLLPNTIDVEMIEGVDLFNSLYNTTYVEKSVTVGPVEQIEINSKLQLLMASHETSQADLEKSNIAVML